MFGNILRNPVYIIETSATAAALRLISARLVALDNRRLTTTDRVNSYSITHSIVRLTSQFSITAKAAHTKYNKK